MRSVRNPAASAAARLVVCAGGLFCAARAQAAATLVGHWSLNDGSGMVALDSSANGLHGTLVGPGVTWTSGQIGGGLDFDGSGDAVVIPFSPAMNFSTAFSLSFWINAPAVQNGTAGIATIIDKAHGTGGPTGWTVQARAAEPGSISFALGTGAGFPEPRIAGVLDGTWHHVSILVSLSPTLLIRGYRDGVLVTNYGDGSTMIANNSGDLRLSTPQRPFVGKLDDVRLFSGLLNTFCETGAVSNPAGFGDCNTNGLPDVCDVDASDGVGPTEHRVFVTSTTHNGNLGGLAGADSICQQLAQNAGLRRMYKAIMSDSTTAANARLVLNGGAIQIFDAGGTPSVVKANGNLWDGQPLGSAINLDQFGSSHTTFVWTGTNPDGLPETFLGEPNTYCNDWTHTTGLRRASVGRSSNTSPSWILHGETGCSSLWLIYCISQLNQSMQVDCNANSVPDSCEPDSDTDGRIDDCDNCPLVANPGQENSGDADGIADACDNCPALANPDQADFDGDGTGDLCDSDFDGDLVDDAMDVCPAASPCVLSDATGRPRSDLNADCLVDGRDIALLVDCLIGGGAACTGVDPDGDALSGPADAGDDAAAFVSHVLAPPMAPCP